MQHITSSDSVPEITEEIIFQLNCYNTRKNKFLVSSNTGKNEVVNYRERKCQAHEIISNQVLQEEFPCFFHSLLSPKHGRYGNAVTRGCTGDCC